MQANILRIALVQHPCTANPIDNLERSLAGIATAAADGAQLVMLQELHNHRYFCQTQDSVNFDLAEPVPGRTSERLARAAREHSVVVIGSVFERRAAGIYHNTAVVLDRDGSLAGRYRKMHIPDDPGYHEKYYFTPGERGFFPIDTSIGRLGVLVCWDQWFPEAARLMALAGAQILLYPSAIGWDPVDEPDERARQLDSWQTIQRSHAIANALPLAACNRVGSEPHPSGRGEITFWGSSFICGPQGEFLARCNERTDQVIAVDVDLDRTDTTRRAWPFLRDRRIDAYTGLDVRIKDAPDQRVD